MAGRTYLIGVDGGSFRVLDPWLDDGTLPVLAELRARGAHGVLRSSVPPITVPSWSSFATGKNPGKHGVYEFLVKQPGTYHETPVNSSSCRAATFWELLGQAGRTVVVANFPMTYPPRPVNGALVAGFLTPSGRRDFTHPTELLAEIEERFGPYYLYMKTRIAGTAMTDGVIAGILRDCREMLDYKFRVAHWLIDRYAPDLFATHVWGTDRIQHELWHLLDPDHPRYRADLAARHRPAIVDYYRRLDAEIGRLRDRLGADDRLVVCSDHGFGPITRIIDLNLWLLSEGYLQLTRDASTRLRLWLWRRGLTWERLFRGFVTTASRFGLKLKGSAPVQDLTTFRMGKPQWLLSMADVDWTRTRAYAKTGMGQIVINLAGREPQGTVAPGADYTALVDAIAAKLAALVDPDTGTPVRGEIHRRDDVYSGPVTPDCPDLTFLPQASGYFAGTLTGFNSNHVFMDNFALYGSHTMEGILLATGAGVRPGEIHGASIMDLAPTLLHLHGCEVPDDMDGRVLEPLLDPELLAAHPVRHAAAPEGDTPDAHELSEEEREDVIQRLKDLGYLS